MKAKASFMTIDGNSLVNQTSSIMVFVAHMAMVSVKEGGLETL